VPGEIRTILDACSMFSSLDPQRLDMLAAMARRRTCPRGEVIFRQDEPCPGLFIVGEGRVRIYKLAPSGKEHVLHLAGPGMTFAEVAVIGGFPCPAFAEAMEPTICALLPAEPFRRALHTDHELCLGLMTGMAGWVRTLVGLMEDIVLRDAIGRLARYLLDAAAGQGGDDIKLPALKRHLASHLNLTGETLSRTLKRLADAQLIEQIDARRLRIIDAAHLRDVADGLFPEL